jgi:uncharacterized protein DUF2490
MKKHILRGGLFLLLALGTVNGFTQKQVDSQQHSWYMYFGNYRLNERWGIHTQYQWRREGLGKTWQQSLLQTGLNYYTKAGPVFTFGYGWAVTYPYGKQPIIYVFNEHRIWQQFLLKQHISRFYISHRFRFEQRWFENKTTDAEGRYTRDGWKLRHRGRYQFHVIVAITKKELQDNILFLSLYEEVFIRYGKGIGKNALDQNRAYAAFGWRFTKNVNVQMGYMNQYLLKSDGIRAERNHTFQLSLTYNLNLQSG